METKLISESGQKTQPVTPFGTSPNLASQLKQTTYDGAVLKDRYEIEGELGRGGIGVVYLARDRQLMGRRVVVKALLQDSDNSVLTPWFKKKFEQEVEALVRLDHPGIVGVLDAGAMPDGKPFFVMQYVEGATMRSRMKEDQQQGRSMEFDRIAALVRQIGYALNAAHDKGIVHRDLKPENVMIRQLGDGQEQVMLIDFGIATVRDSQFATAAERTKVAGAMPYMAPEQLRGQPDVSSDIWALGVIAYELATNRLPFDADTLVQLHETQRLGPAIKPGQLRANLPPAAEAAILRALDFDPARRHARAGDFADDLLRALTETTTIEQHAQSAQSIQSGQSARIKPGEQTTSLTPETAHVLFMDLVGYSKLPMDQQPKLQRELREVVRRLDAYKKANLNDETISLPTGDGMALVFFRDPMAPVECAVEIARAVKDHPEIKLRMGVHSGPVYRVADINTNRNVAGGGINMAQRVMDCGDADHILVSRTVAEMLNEMGQWAGWLHDLGEQEVKHGARVHVFNLHNGEIGNPQTPEKMYRAVETTVAAEAPAITAPVTEPVAEGAPESNPSSKPLGAPAKLIAAAALAIALIAVAAVWLSRSKSAQLAAPSPTIAPSRTLSYSVKVRLNPKKTPNQPPVELNGEVVFTTGDELCFVFDSAQDGYLYIINEGPQPAAGLPRYNVIFPDPNFYSASAPSLRTGQKNHVPSETPPWFPVDNEQGAEKLWLVWSDRAVNELETVRKWLNERDGGEIKDAGEIKQVQEFLAQNASAARPVAEKDDHQTHLKGGRDGLMIYPVRLEHR